MSAKSPDSEAALPPTTCSARVDYEFQYLNHAGTWQSGPFELDEEAARRHFEAMTARYPRQRYRVIRRTVNEEVIFQNGGSEGAGEND